MSQASAISYELATRSSSPFFARRHLAVVPNVSWGLLPWEADLLVLQKSGYLHEVEIKITMSDWKADAAKGKWSHPKFNQMIRRFWYAAPEKLATRYQEIGIPDFAGVIQIRESGLKRYVEIVRHPKNRNAQKLSDADQAQLLRLGCIKAWRLAYTPETETMVPGALSQ